MSINYDLLRNKILELHQNTPDNVHYIGYGRKMTNGEYTEELGIVFYVFEKKPLAELSSDEVLPKVITIDDQNIVTDVVSSEPAESLDSNCYQKEDESSANHRRSTSGKLTGGVSIGPAAKISAGTLGAIVLDNEDNSFIGITNAHVAFPLGVELYTYNRYKRNPSLSSNVLKLSSQSVTFWDTSSGDITQPGKFDIQATKYSIAKIKRYIPLFPDRYNTSDVALLGIKNVFAPPIPPSYSPMTSLSAAKGQCLSGSPPGLDPSVLNASAGIDYFPFATKEEIDNLIPGSSTLMRSGRTTGLNTGQNCSLVVNDTLVSLNVGYRNSEGQVVVIPFTNCISFRWATNQSNAIAPGDSGSAIIAPINVNGNTIYKIIGLAFAGTSSIPNRSFNLGFLCRIDEIVDKLNIAPLSPSSISFNDPSNWSYTTDSDPSDIISTTKNGVKYWVAGMDSSLNNVYVTYTNNNLPTPTPTPTPLPPTPTPTPTPTPPPTTRVFFRNCCDGTTVPSGDSPGDYYYSPQYFYFSSYDNDQTPDNWPPPIGSVFHIRERPTSGQIPGDGMIGCYTVINSWPGGIKFVNKTYDSNWVVEPHTDCLDCYNNNSAFYLSEFVCIPPPPTPTPTPEPDCCYSDIVEILVGTCVPPTPTPTPTAGPGDVCIPPCCGYVRWTWTPGSCTTITEPQVIDNPIISDFDVETQTIKCYSYFNSSVFDCSDPIIGSNCNPSGQCNIIARVEVDCEDQGNICSTSCVLLDIEYNTVGTNTWGSDPSVNCDCPEAIGSLTASVCTD